MAARKPTPYSSFSAYNKFEVEQKQQDDVQKRQQQMSQHVSKNAPMNQANNQMNRQMSQQGQTRFKHIQTSENLYSILTTGLTQFQNNFKAQNIQPPPMRIFLKLYTEWCGPCKKIEPVLDNISLSPDMKDVIFMKFDAELMIKGEDNYSKELTKILKVGAVPAMFGFIDGKLVGNVMGADINEITGLLNKLAQFN